MDNWFLYYECLKDYKDTYGNSDVPISYWTTKDGVKYNLGQWVNSQRGKYQKGKLSIDKVDLLNKLNFTWSVREKRWLFMYNLAYVYYINNGNVNLSEDYNVIVDGKTYHLGRWVINQRRNYQNTLGLSKCKYNDWCLSPERMALLDAIHIDWQSTNMKLWFLKYEKAYEYYISHGNLIIPSNYRVPLSDGTMFSLYDWLMDNKNKYLYSKDKFNDEQIEALKKIDITKVNYFDYSWGKMYEEAKKYYDIHGNLRVPATYKYTLDNNQEIKLGNWINVQRKRYRGQVINKNGDAITSEQIRLLNEIGMVWHINASFDEMYHYLEVYKSHYGNISIPSKFNTNDGYTYAFDGSIKLGKWLLNQRINTSPLSKNGLKLSLLGIKWPRGKNNNIIRQLSEEYKIDYELNSLVLEHLSILEFLSKINYLKTKNEAICNSKGFLHPIFSMSNYDLELEYKVNLETLINEYFIKESKNTLTYKKR